MEAARHYFKYVTFLLKKNKTKKKKQKKKRIGPHKLNYSTKDFAQYLKIYLELGTDVIKGEMWKQLTFMYPHTRKNQNS